jgi:predicted porin
LENKNPNKHLLSFIHLEKYDMKKTLIALAAIAATSAFAQSTVTLYGVLDQGYNTSTTTVGTTESKVTGIQSILSGNRVGFKGTEDLGGGLKANFQFEFGAVLDGAATAGALSSNRNSFVGVEGPFGAVTAGLVYTLIHNVQGAYDNNGNATASGWLGGGTSRVRQANALTYTTPDMKGFTAQVQLGFGETAQTSGVTPAVTGDAGNSTAFALNYAQGPLTVKFASETVNLTKLAYAAPGIATAVDLGNALADFTANSIGASYDLGVAKLTAVRTTAKAGSAALAGEVTTNNFGVSVPVGAVTLNGTISNGSYTTGTTNTDISGYQIGANYALSKRTTAYTLLGQGKNEATTATKGESFAVGVRHTF